MGVCYRPPEQEEVEKAFFRQLENQNVCTVCIYSQNQKGFIYIILRQWWGTMGHGLLPGRKPGPQQLETSLQVELHGTMPQNQGCCAKSQAQHQAVLDYCPGAQAGDRVVVAGHAVGTLAGKRVAEKVSSCTLSGWVSKRSTGSLQRLNSPHVPSKWNYSMKLWYEDKQN